MNLVAKEYVACQVDDPGVLILSRHGRARRETMREALPGESPTMWTATRERRSTAGLTMDEEERRVTDGGPADVASVVATINENWVDELPRRGIREPRKRFQPVSDSGDLDAWLDDPTSAATRGLVALPRLRRHALAPIVRPPGPKRSDSRQRPCDRPCARCTARDDTDVSDGERSRPSSDIRETRRDRRSIVYAGNHGLEIEGDGVLEAFRPRPTCVHYQDPGREALAKAPGGDSERLGSPGPSEKGASRSPSTIRAVPEKHLRRPDSIRPGPRPA